MIDGSQLVPDCRVSGSGGFEVSIELKVISRTGFEWTKPSDES